MNFDYIFLYVVLLVSNSLSFHLSNFLSAITCLFIFQCHICPPFLVYYLTLVEQTHHYMRVQKLWKHCLLVSYFQCDCWEIHFLFFFFCIGPLSLSPPFSPSLCSSLLKYHDVVSWCGLFLFIVLSTGITLAIRKFMFFNLGIFSCFISLIILSFCCFCLTFWETFFFNLHCF